MSDRHAKQCRKRVKHSLACPKCGQRILVPVPVVLPERFFCCWCNKVFELVEAKR